MKIRAKMDFAVAMRILKVWGVCKFAKGITQVIL